MIEKLLILLVIYMMVNMFLYRHVLKESWGWSLIYSFTISIVALTLIGGALWLDI